MDKSLIDIAPEAALDDAADIENIISTIERSMDDLSKVIHATIPDRVETEWSKKLSDDWNKYYTSDIPEVMEEMGKSSKNIKMAAENAKGYSKEEE